MFFAPEPIRAYDVLHCNGDPVKLSTFPIWHEVISGTLSSAQHDDITYSETFWNDVTGMATVFSGHSHNGGAEAIPPFPDSTH
ncbi:MAG TPA: hypothetical protein VK524_02760, partial [Polyangiaceae bacterium]|nr:hypothetical protein [Polyangiaceae bacterium]